LATIAVVASMKKTPSKMMMRAGQGEIGRILEDVATCDDSETFWNRQHAERQQGKDDGDDPERRLAQLVAEFETARSCRT
jgi:hypothetical protein